MNRTVKSLFAAIVSIFIFNQSSAQFYSTGSDPARLKWNEIKTERYFIIYPTEADSLARRYAVLLEKSADAVNGPLRSTPRKLPVVLHPYNVYSNGLVSWAPRRMELYTTPPSLGSYSMNWEKQLVLHEGRHVAQMTMFERGIFKPLSWLIGEQAVGLGAGLYINKWALEGDAVVSETANSSAGRGRSPSHLLYFKAAFLEGDFRNIQQWAFGSFKKYTPNEYSLGYLLLSGMRFRSGNYHLMGDVMTTLVDEFYNPSGATKAYRKASGLSVSENLKEVTDLMTNKWRREDSIKAPFSYHNFITPKTDDYISYLYPMVTPEGVTYAIKTDLDEASRLVKIYENGNEETLYFTGILSGEPIMKRGKIYWSEKIPSLRWEHESFSEIVEYDISTGKTKRLTKRAVYMNPSFSNDGFMMAVAEYHPKGGSSLVLLDMDGFVIKSSFKAPLNGQIKESIIIDGKVYVTVITDKGLGLYSIEPDKGKWNLEIEEQHQIIEGLSELDGSILFSSDLDGTDNIYHYDPLAKFVRKLTSVPLAAKSPQYCRLRNSLFYSNFTKNGFKLVEAPIDSLKWEVADLSKPYKYEMAEELSRQAGFNIDTVSLKDAETLKSEPYRRGEHLFRVHSWTPLFVNTDILNNISYENFYNVVSPGASIYTQNSLGTAEGMLGYSYHGGFHSGHMRFSYRGFYPVFEFRADLNDRDKQRITLVAGDLFNPEMVTDTVSGSPYFSASLLTYAPLNFSSGGWTRGLIPKMNWRYSNDSYYSFREGRYQDYQHITLGIQYYQVQRMALRNLYPKWGFGTNLQFNMMPFAGENFGSTLYWNAYGYIPGLMKNHGIRLSFAYQRQFYEGKRYLMRNLAASPRGYNAHYSIHYTSLFTDYAIPINLGDITVSWLLYLKRARVIPFFDWAYSRGMNDSRHLYSGGADLLFDFNIFNIPLPLTAGVRFIRTAESKSIFQFIFTTPLI
ncbi:MAG: hypothetical protein PHO95_02085 [Bacteroidales bacterium]|jgi:hypothetical protein|nr:hypothetical protein [Bacteroidales bacterium]